MDTAHATETNPTSVNRESGREIVVTRRFNAPVHLVWAAWTTPDLFGRWWTPKSFGITVISRDMDIRTGGSYRLVLSHPAAPEPMTFFGKYLEVTPTSRLVWTNEESADGAVTTVTFAESGGTTLVTLRDLYPSQEALEAAIASGSTSGYPEQFAQLDELLPTLGN